MISIQRATAQHLDLVAPLFDAYRQFYGQPADAALAREFLAQRMQCGESVILLALEDAGAAMASGFIQLYPLFSSTLAARSWLLNDLFVAPACRGRGVARLLMEAARRHALASGAAVIELATARSNLAAQALYDSLGYQRDELFLHYELNLARCDP